MPLSQDEFGRGIGDLDVVRVSPGADALAPFRGQVRGEGVGHDRDPDVGRVEAAQVAAEFQELGALLDQLDVAVELVLAQVQGGEQVPDSAVAVVGRPPTTAWLPVGVLVLATVFGPLPAGMGHEVERPELVHTEDDFGLADLGYDLGVGDRVEVLDPRLLGRVVRITGGFPGLQALKGDSFLAEQDAQALVADVVDPPSATTKSASLVRLQVENGRSCSVGLDFAIFLISRRSGRVKVFGRPPEYFGYNESKPSALKLWITSAPGRRW